MGEGGCPPRYQLAKRLPDDLADRLAEQPLGGQVGIHHPPVEIQHHHRILHELEDLASGDRGQVEQAEAEDSPHQHRAGQHEQERRQLDPPERSDVEVVQQVGEDRQHQRHDQQQALAPVQPRQAHQCPDEQCRATPHHQVGVDQKRPEQRPDLGDGLSRVGGRRRRIVAHQVVGGRVGQQHDHRHGRDRQRDHHRPVHPSVPAGVLHDEREPGGREQADAQPFGVAPPQLGGQVGGAPAPGRRRDPTSRRRPAPPPGLPRPTPAGGARRRTHRRLGRRLRPAPSR